MMPGLNSDDILGGVDRLVPVLESLLVRPVVGVVCDPGVPARRYRAAGFKLSLHADILWRPFDSYSLLIQGVGKGTPRYSVRTYENRARDYAVTLGDLCGAEGGLECGNEITLGFDFTGPQIVSQTARAIEVCRAHRLNSLVTYFYDPTNSNLFQDIRNWGLDATWDGMSLYPRTFPRPVPLDEVFRPFWAARPGTPKMISEFGDQDPYGSVENVTPEMHRALVRTYLTWRPSFSMMYLPRGFSWSAQEYLLSRARENGTTVGLRETVLYQELCRDAA